MFVTIHFLITLEDTVAGTSTHKVIVTLTRGKTTAHSGPCLATTLTALAKKSQMNTFISLKHIILYKLRLKIV